MKKLTYLLPAGTVSIVHIDPSQNVEGESDEVQINRLLSRIVPPEATVPIIVDEVDIPADKIYRNAWVRNDAAKILEVDMPKARVIHMRRLAFVKRLLTERLAGEEVEHRARGDLPAAANAAAQLAAARGVDLSAVSDTALLAPNPVALEATWPAALDVGGVRQDFRNIVPGP